MEYSISRTTGSLDEGRWGVRDPGKGARGEGVYDSAAQFHNLCKSDNFSANGDQKGGDFFSS